MRILITSNNNDDAGEYKIRTVLDFAKKKVRLLGVIPTHMICPCLSHNKWFEKNMGSVRKGKGNKDITPHDSNNLRSASIQPRALI